MVESLATISGDLGGDSLGWGAIVAFLSGFVIAQLWKFVVGMWTGRGKSRMENLRAALGYLSRSGGMPSGHSAGMVAATVFLGGYYGFGSGVFALAVAVTGIVLYDAMHVRYAVGEQGKALNKLLKKAGEKELPVVEGHTFGQVAVGSILGLIVGIAIFGIMVGW